MKWWTISIEGHGDYKFLGTIIQAMERADFEAERLGAPYDLRDATKKEVADTTMAVLT